MKHLLHMADHRGSDVRLSTGALQQELLQDVACPSFMWRWSLEPGFQFTNEQHTNIRLAALLMAADAYVICMWTMSACNVADIPSRVHAS